MVFPSVTAAALAAMAMQEELRFAQPNKGDDRLVMRVVIALGDVLHEEGALVGDTVVLTSRIESITLPDEIYLSAAAWLANQTEIRTAFVDTFPLKGFPDSVSVYRVEQTHRTRVIADQFIVHPRVLRGALPGRVGIIRGLLVQREPPLGDAVVLEAGGETDPVRVDVRTDVVEVEIVADVPIEIAVDTVAGRRSGEAGGSPRRISTRFLRRCRPGTSERGRAALAANLTE